MTSWNWYIEHFLEKEHLLEWQKNILNQLIEWEEKKVNPKIMFDNGAIGLVMKSHEKLTPLKIIHSGPATIVFWNDKTKTVVKCSENDIYDEYEAFCAALAIKMFGSNSHLKKMIHNKTEEGGQK